MEKFQNFFEEEREESIKETEEVEIVKFEQLYDAC